MTPKSVFFPPLFCYNQVCNVCRCNYKYSYNCFILSFSDRPQIYDIKAINKIQENIVEALKVQISRNHSNDTQTFQKLMLKINELRALGSSHSLHLQWFRCNWSRLKLPPLFRYVQSKWSQIIASF